MSYLLTFFLLTIYEVINSTVSSGFRSPHLSIQTPLPLHPASPLFPPLPLNLILLILLIPLPPLIPLIPTPPPPNFSPPQPPPHIAQHKQSLHKCPDPIIGIRSRSRKPPPPKHKQPGINPQPNSPQSPIHPQPNSPNHPIIPQPNPRSTSPARSHP